MKKGHMFDGMDSIYVLQIMNNNVCILIYIIHVCIYIYYIYICTWYWREDLCLFCCVTVSIQWICVLEIEKARKATPLQHYNFPLQEHPAVDIYIYIYSIYKYLDVPQNLHEYPKVNQGSLNFPYCGDQTIQYNVYGNFWGISLIIVHCLGWEYNDTWKLPVNVAWDWHSQPPP